MTSTASLKRSAPSQIVLIGASTGGPGQIQKIITALPELQETSVIIAQHMAKEFIPSFAKRLQEHSTNPIEIAEHGKNICTGHIYLCNGYTEVAKHDLQLQFIQNSSPEHAYNPDIDLLFNSMVPFVKDLTLLGIILTGIGEDGVGGCKNLNEHNARCLTESEQSAIVDGMPGRARECVPGIEVLHMSDIIQVIKEFSH